MQPQQHLKAQPLHLVRGQAMLLLVQQLEQVAVHKLEHHNELLLATKGFKQPNNVGMTECFEHLELSQSVAMDGGVFGVLKALNGHVVARLGVDTLQDNAIRTFADQLNDSILVHNWRCDWPIVDPRGV